MCGIAGIWGDSGTITDLEGRVRAMCEAQIHRGPDGGDVVVVPEAGVGLGHRRLAILDLSPAGRQPMWSASGRYLITYNGEIYNFRELRAELEQRGARFVGHSDTEAILAATDAYGPEAVFPRLNGIFAFGLWDNLERTMYLVRDRVGIKPLYYTSAGPLVFASELKGVRAAAVAPRELDLAALDEYFRLGYVPREQSIDRGIRKVPPGHFLALRLGGERQIRPFIDTTPPLRREAPVSDEEWTRQLDDLLRAVVRSQTISDVPVGALLSGGVDSSLVVAMLQSLGGPKTRTYTIGFSDKSYDESDHAQAVAEHLGTDHQRLIVTPEEARGVIPRLPEIYDEPFADSSQIPTFLVAQLARRSVTVALSGDGGDELFCGYNRYASLPAVWSASRMIHRPFRRHVARGLAIAADALHKREVPSWMSARVRDPSDKLYKIAAVFPEPTPQAMYDRVTSRWAQSPLSKAAHVEIAPWPKAWERLQYAEQMMLADRQAYLPGDILTKVDRASMAVGLEARVPLLDNRIIDFADRVPLSLKRRGNVSKYILRQVLYSYVPRGLIERPKSGFGIPLGDWLRGPLREWAGDLLSGVSLSATPELASAPIHAAWKRHLEGAAGYTERIWTVLMFVAWRDTWRHAHPRG